MLSVGVLAALAGGCVSPMGEESESSLRRAVLDSLRREVAGAEAFPEKRVTQREPGTALDIKPELMERVEAMAGIDSYPRDEFPMDADLLGQAQRTVAISLERAVRTAVENNLEVQFARIAPAIGEAQVTQAEAAFDWAFFSDFDWSSSDQPQTSPSVGGRATGVGADQRQTVTWSAGLRRQLTTGGRFSVQQQYRYTDVETDNLFTIPDPAHEAAVTLQLVQPLLRGFGSDVALAQVRLARNAEREEIARLRSELNRIVTQTEEAYWLLVRSKQELQVQQRLLERGVTVRDQLKSRRILDVKPAELSDAVANVERRRGDVIQTQNALRQASDTLKVLMNDPELPVGSELLLVPVDVAIDEPIEFSELDALTTGLSHRPEIEQSILSIDNTSIRQEVADNNRLPQLDLDFQTQFAGLDDDFGSAYSEVDSGKFVNFLVGLSFEQALGNRLAEAQYRQRRLERMQATIAYRNTVQTVVRDVKGTLRDVVTNYALIEQRRSARLAAAENLRTLLVEKETTRGFDADFLDLELRRQEALASAERDEIAALTDYNTSIARMYQAMGTALERNRIEFVVPDSADVFDRPADVVGLRGWAVTDRGEPAGASGDGAPADGAAPQP